MWPEFYMQLLIIFSIVTRNISLKITFPEKRISFYGVFDIWMIPELDSRSRKALTC